jgi:hypothetical protein
MAQRNSFLAEIFGKTADDITALIKNGFCVRVNTLCFSGFNDARISYRSLFGDWNGVVYIPT